MGEMFRSDQMVLAQLFIQTETAYSIISDLGEAGCVQFRDLNDSVNTFQRKFVSEVRRCDEMERKLRYIEAEVKKDAVTIPDPIDLPKAPNPREIIDLEAHIEKTESDIKELSTSAVNLKSNYLELTELYQVLEKTGAFFNEQDEANSLDSVYKVLIPEDSHNVSIRGKLGFVAGVVNRERIPAFERMLWRVSRGNVFLRQADIEQTLQDPTSGNEINKMVFIAFFQGEQLKARIKKICSGFHATLYTCPSVVTEREIMLNEVRKSLEDLELVLNQTQEHRQRVLTNVAKELQNWIVMVRKMKAIYHTLNFFNMDVTKKCLIGECWAPQRDIGVVQKILADGSNVYGSAIPSFLNVISTREPPPTFNRTNKFTRGFQNLIDSYGIASYQEANPALYTIITFPFIFAVMFGDCGHALILIAFGAYLAICEKSLMKMKSTNEIFNIFFAGRYIILLMGIFSFYTGFIYNDMFSKSFNIFGSKWFPLYNESTVRGSAEMEFDPGQQYSGTPYVFGLDPVWQMATNKIIFLNSYKMKLSIIFGVVHMIFGVCVSVFNFVHFKKYSSIVLEFLPQIILLLFLFLWMVAMMFIKWTLYSANSGDVVHGTSCAPSVLIYFINMMLMKSTQAPHGCEVYMFEFQPILQQILVFTSLLCIPVMLLGKPLYIKFTRSHRQQKGRRNGGVNPGLELSDIPEETFHNGVVNIQCETSSSNDIEIDEEEEPMSEIFIHQAIHTIEYVLSTVSHTASYLRLWALSLAHAQLSEVLWNMLFRMGLSQSGYIGVVTTFVFFGAWAIFTVAILVTMEGLSAFLHTLRLHWVEFMSKFYQGLGYPFQPFSFKRMLEENDSTVEE